MNPSTLLTLPTLLTAVARERTSTGVLQAATTGLAAVHGVALVRVWLTSAGERRGAPGERARRLAVSVGDSAEHAAGDSSEAGISSWWGPAGIEEILRLPLRSGAEDVGLLALFGRAVTGATEREWLDLIADQTATALVNAAAFEELESTCASLSRENDELRESFQDLFEEAPIAYVHESVDSRFVRANRAAKRMLGVESEDIVGRLGSSFVADTPENQRRMRQALDSVGRGAEASGVVLELRRHDNGKPVWVQWSSRPAPGGQYTRTMMVDISDRVLIEQTKAALEFSLESGQVGDWDLDLLRDTSRRSLRHDQCFGYDAPVSEADWGRATFARHIHPEDRERVLGGMQKAVDERLDWGSEFRVIWADESVHWLVARGRVYGMQAGVATRMLGIVMDITERKRAEETLRETKAALDFALESANIGDWDLDLRNDTSRRSLRHDECFGFTRPIPEAEWGIETFARCIHPSDRDRVTASLRRAATDLLSWTAEFRVIWPDASIHWIVALGSIYRTVEGKATRMLGIVMDITERKRAEEALRASEELARGQLEALTSTLEELAAESSPDHLVEHVLRTMTEQIGAHGSILWRRDDLDDSLQLAFETGRFVTDEDATNPARSEDTSLPLEPPWNEALSNRSIAVMVDIEQMAPFRFRDRLLALGVLTILVVPMSFSGQIEGAIGILFTEERAFRTAELELAQALAHQAMLAMQVTRLSAQSLSAAIVRERNRMAREVHDTLAQGFTGVIVQLEASADARSNGLIREADEHIRRASDVARESLREARRSVKALRPLELEEMDLTDALEALTRKLTVGTSVVAEFGVRGDPRKLPSEWDANLLRIVQEVLTNVLRHAHATRVDARVVFAANEVRLEISDDGRGFDAAVKSDGFGLLGIRERVEEMGGSLEVRSADADGTAISIALPHPGPSRGLGR